MKIVKGIFLPVGVAIVIGFIMGKYVFRNYRDNLYDVLSSSKLYLIEKGEYDSILDMSSDNDNYVYYKDNDKYRMVVGITNDYHNIDKIKELYNDDVMVLEYYIPNDMISSEQKKYDIELRKTNDKEKMLEIVNDILKLYHNQIKLITG